MGIFNKFMEGFRSAQVAFDPATLDDPVALQTEWTPAHPGGMKMRTHQLVQVDPGRMEFRATTGALLFASMTLMAGIGALGFLLFILSGGQDADDGLKYIFGPLIALVLLGFGVALLMSFLKPVVFDQELGAFWKGRTAPDQTFNRLSLENYAELKEIHAIQLLSEIVPSKSSFISYELNLILNDGKRFNVIDHGDKAKIIEDAGTLAAFLDVPVWDVIDFATPSK